MAPEDFNMKMRPLIYEIADSTDNGTDCNVLILYAPRDTFVKEIEKKLSKPKKKPFYWGTRSKKKLRELGLKI